MELDEHPLAWLLHHKGWSATNYLARLDPIHQRLGYGRIYTRERKRVSRWIRGGVTPEEGIRRAMAHLHQIPEEEITARPWPDWLRLACLRDRDLLQAEWNAQATAELLDRIAAGGPMDRRAFLVVTGVTPVLAQAAAAQPAAARHHGRRISAATPDLFEQGLAVLRRQDDQLGSGQVHASARTQLRLITDTLTGASYTEATGRRLYAAAAEAARSCGWTAHDSGHHALAEEFYVLSLRAATSADDPVTTANTLAFWAITRYSNGDPYGAVALAEEALRHTGKFDSPRLEAVLHARRARAHAKAGDHRAAARAQEAAFTAYDRTRERAPDDEPDAVYWVSLGELESWAATNAMNLGEPARALGHFEAIPAAQRDEGHDPAAFPRAAALRLARTAEAHIALGDLDAAVATAHHAIDHLGGVTSARSTSTLGDLRTQLAAHRDTAVVRDFLSRTA
ncbi:transcriptional regulator [Streptomyces johnsoniae]|uniref:Transcriptional regulator n=1 Tax=Streptomyces johnsoniae TaxID=3075532 RepID=A0ABU2SEF4_9ACTN|nr:transcriptional regulator [Streptomyces sp. DSM 41886]MDT0446794.1 transcriptional regulator [Streptomyces sp. DSM 41886]